jgi:hypothetical protein
MLKFQKKHTTPVRFCQNLVGLENQNEKSLLSRVCCEEDLNFLFPGNKEKILQIIEILAPAKFQTIFFYGIPILTFGEGDTQYRLESFQYDIHTLRFPHIPKGYEKIYGMPEYVYVDEISGRDEFFDLYTEWEYAYMRILFGLSPATEEEKKERVPFS